ncbi:MAG: HD domain-containing protein, partial [Deltaproteobacteria bacterium]|nr:HD domain-containing protein [Deltaproteobacteria bacterium]
GGRVFASGQAEIVYDVLSDPRFIRGANKASSMMCAPLMIKDKSMGIINISTEAPFEYFSGDLKLFQSVTSQTAAAMQIAILYNDQTSAFDSTVCTLAETIEKRDHMTGKHTRRVMEYSKSIGVVLGLSLEELAGLELSAALHDIGNIGLKDSVLLKQGKLSGEEFEEIKKHPLYAEEILGHISQLKDIIPGVKYHHERFDGKGYPEGLSAGRIPLSARIITVADCYDTMTTDRPYRKAMDIDSAFDELRKGMGTQFDPEVVEAFFSTDVVSAYFTANSKKKIIS